MTYQAPKDTIELDDNGNEVRLCGNCGHEVEPGTKHLKDEEGCTMPSKNGANQEPKA